MVGSAEHTQRGPNHLVQSILLTPAVATCTQQTTIHARNLPSLMSAKLARLIVRKDAKFEMQPSKFDEQGE